MTPLQEMATQTKTTTAPPNLQFQQEYIHRAAWKAGVLGSINVLAMVLAGRLIGLVGIAGGIWLTFLALGQPDVPTTQWKLIALGIYAGFFGLPALFFSLRPPVAASPSRS